VLNQTHTQKEHTCDTVTLSKTRESFWKKKLSFHKSENTEGTEMQQIFENIFDILSSAG
jgi:hypothetical protein